MTNKDVQEWRELIERLPVSPYEAERFFTGHSRGHTVGRQRPQVGFKRLTPGAVLPVKAHASDSGYDLCAVTDVIIAPGETVVIPTGIAVKLPPGFEATVRPRSGVTSRTKLRVQLGTIDEGYGGEIGVIVDNIAQLTYELEDYGDGLEIDTVRHNALHTIDNSGHSPLGNVLTEYSVPVGTYIIRAGDRIAQLVITRLPELEAVEIDDLGDSERGANGFGSSGV